MVFFLCEGVQFLFAHANSAISMPSYAARSIENMEKTVVTLLLQISIDVLLESRAGQGRAGQGT